MPRKLSPEEIDQIRARYSDLVNYGADDTFDPINPMTYRDSGGDSLLHIAVLRSDLQTASRLLEAGVDPNLPGDMGDTPLHYAGQERNAAMYKLLLEHGAREDIKNQFGKMPILQSNGD